MKTICSFCETVINPGKSPHDPVSHGVCDSFYRRIRREFGFDLRKFLDTLDAPVFLVDKNAIMVEANMKVITLTGKPLREINGQLCGKVLECLNAELKEGCGTTPDCTIRSSVKETWTTGRPIENRIAVLRKTIRNLPVEQKFSISTCKDGEVVLLRLEPVRN